MEKEKNVSPPKQQTEISISSSISDKPSIGKFRLKVPQAHLISSLQNSNDKINIEKNLETSISNYPMPPTITSPSSNILKVKDNTNNNLTSVTDESKTNLRSIVKTNSFEDFQPTTSTNEKKKPNLETKTEKCGTSAEARKNVNARIENFVCKTLSSKLLNDNNLVSTYICISK